MSDRRLPSALLALLVVATAAPGQAQEHAAAPRTAALELRNAIARALSRNPGLVAAELDLSQARQNVRAEEGRYPYVFAADAGYTRVANARLGANDTINSYATRSYTIGSAIRRTFPFGTIAEFRMQGERLETDQSSLALNGSTGSVTGLAAGASYAVTGRASLTQPLLRGAGRRVGELELRAARDSRVASEKSRARVKSELVRDTIVAYWELWYAGASVDIERAALELAKRQEDEARQQVAAGQLARADVLTFSTRVAQLSESLVSADVQKRQRALELGRLMGVNDPSSERLTARTDPPAPGPSASRAEIEAALRSGSVELAELEAQVRVARTRAGVAGESTRPLLDLDGYIESTGLSERIPHATERAGQLKWTAAHVGLTFELPLDDRRLRAERASAWLAVRIAEQNLKAARDRITSEATLAVANQQAAAQGVILAQRTREVAEQTFDAQRARFELGEAIPIQVQLAQDDVRRAQLSVARARVDRAQADADVLHLSGKLLALYDSPRPKN